MEVHFKILSHAKTINYSIKRYPKTENLSFCNKRDFLEMDLDNWNCQHLREHTYKLQMEKWKSP